MNQSSADHGNVNNEERPTMRHTEACAAVVQHYNCRKSTDTRPHYSLQVHVLYQYENQIQKAITAFLNMSGFQNTKGMITQK